MLPYVVISWQNMPKCAKTYQNLTQQVLVVFICDFDEIIQKLPEAQRTQGIESLTWFIFSTEFVLFVAAEILLVKLNTLGSLCLWQCFNFRFAIFPKIRFLFLLSKHFWFVANQFKIWSSGNVTCIAWFQSWPPGCVTRIATLPWNALLALSVSIEFVSSSARVTSV